MPTSFHVAVALLVLPLAAGLAAANECGDIAVFTRNAANPVGVNTNAAICAVGEVDALPSLLNPGSDLVKVRYLTATTDPGAPTLTVQLDGLGFDGARFIAGRVSFATGPDGYDTDDIALPDGIASSGTLTVTVIHEETATTLGTATYATADAIVALDE